MSYRTSLFSAFLFAALTLGTGTILAQDATGPRLTFSPSSIAADGAIVITAGSDVKIHVQTQNAGAYFELWYGLPGNDATSVDSPTSYLSGVTNRNGEFSMKVAVPASMHGLKLVAQAFSVNDAGEYVESQRMRLTFHDPKNPTDPVARKQLAPAAVDNDALPLQGRK